MKCQCLCDGFFRSTHALHFCGQESLEAAVTWLAQHEEDAGLDEPLLVPKVSLQQILVAWFEKVGVKWTSCIRLVSELCTEGLSGLARSIPCECNMLELEADTPVSMYELPKAVYRELSYCF